MVLKTMEIFTMNLSIIRNFMTVYVCMSLYGVEYNTSQVFYSRDCLFR